MSIVGQKIQIVGQHFFKTKLKLSVHLGEVFYRRDNFHEETRNVMHFVNNLRPPIQLAVERFRKHQQILLVIYSHTTELRSRKEKHFAYNMS